jgi:hypothetical protein
MKILFIEPCFVNFGGYFRAYSLCLALSKKGVKVDLLVGGKSDFTWKIKKTKVNNNLNLYELPRINLHFFLNGRILRGIIALCFGLFRKYDIIHACVPVQLESNIPAFFLKILGKKVVMDWDDYWEKSAIFGEYKIMKKYVAFCEKRAPKFFGNMVVVSDFLKKLSEKRGAKRVLKLINGVNEDQFKVYSRKEGREKLKLEKDGKYLITFGNTYTNDRAYLLFKTVERICSLDSSIRLMFNFDPYKVFEEQKLEKRVDKNCLKNVINVGYIQQSDQGYYLGASDATIFLMNDADNERACFPIRIGSYLNGEAVIITNDVNSEAGNLLKKYDCAVIGKDIEDVAQKTITYFSDPLLRKKLKENVIIAKQELSWNKIIDCLIEFYQCVLKN